MLSGREYLQVTTINHFVSDRVHRDRASDQGGLCLNRGSFSTTVEGFIGVVGCCFEILNVQAVGFLGYCNLVVVLKRLHPRCVIRVTHEAGDIGCVNFELTTSSNITPIARAGLNR